MKTTRTWTRRIVKQKSDTGFEEVEIITIRNKKQQIVATLTVLPGSMGDEEILDFIKEENPR